MKRPGSFAISLLLLLTPMSAQVYAAASSHAGSTPPIEQPLVREGDFAVKLANSLKLTNSTDEGKAELALASVGIAPRNGWVTDYPVTPDILAETRESAAKAAEGGRLAVNMEKAVETVGKVSVDIGLPITFAGASGKIRPESNYYGSEKIPPQTNYHGSRSGSQNSSGYDDYPSQTGLPVVTYYRPPADYRYLYSYIPFPFWWGGLGYGGFFMLNDFVRVVVLNGPNGSSTSTVTNLVTAPSGQVAAVNPADLGNTTPGAVAAPGAVVVASQGAGDAAGTSANAQKSAASILGRNSPRNSPGTAVARHDMDRTGRAGGGTALSSASAQVGRGQASGRGAANGLIPPTRLGGMERDRDVGVNANRGVNRPSEGSGISGHVASVPSQSVFGNVPRYSGTPIPWSPGVSGALRAHATKASQPPGASSPGIAPSRSSMSPAGSSGSFTGLSGVHTPSGGGIQAGGGMGSVGRGGNTVSAGGKARVESHRGK